MWSDRIIRSAEVLAVEGTYTTGDTALRRAVLTPPALAGSLQFSFSYGQGFPQRILIF